MRALPRIPLALIVAAVLTAAAPANAQLDVEPPLPNVLLLVDTSGSMEYLVPTDASGNHQLPGAIAGSACAAPAQTTVLNRWATLVSVLTGTINNFSCKNVNRDSTFAAEYGINGVQPYDTNYIFQYHRPLSNGCAIGPGTMPTNWYDWPTNALAYHDISGTAVPCVTPWSQATDGILDTFRTRVRFGLMTFDTFPDAGTGASGNAVDAAGGTKGMWSYFLNWNGSGVSKTGNPPACVPQTFDVGARNQAAPPWEGRLIPFGPYNSKLADIQTQNDHIQAELASLRPYGATPIAGMFDDAKDFLLNDTTTDPSTGAAFGPNGDVYYQGGCRKMFIILLSDGEPNQDMMPACGQSGGTCPYAQPDVTAATLAALPGSKQILTYVIGFGVSNPTDLTPLGLTSCTQLNPATQCVNPTAGLKACCQLAKIAAAGGTSHAYFADDLVSLKQQLSTVLSSITAASTARTAPVFSTVGISTGQGVASAAGYRFISSFTTQNGGQLWTGNLTRERFSCVSQNGTSTAVAQKPTSALGDDFAANINSNDTLHPRKFFTYVAPALTNGVITSGQSIRPSITANDGLGTYGMTSSQAATQLLDGASFASSLQNVPAALGLSSTVLPQLCSLSLGATSVSACTNMLLRWEDGLTNAGISVTRDVTACPAGSICSELGSIYHSTPTAIGPPRELIRDDSYVTFAAQQQLRPIVLYTASTDGQLHAFKVASSDPTDSLKVDSLSNNELWSFMPPVVLPNLMGSYNQQALLLDGPPVVADVVFERKRTVTPTWSSVLVGGGGTAGGFFYALDITSPLNPKFLWQLSTDILGTALFGANTPAPALATVSITDTSVTPSDVKEVAVAILGGGSAATATGNCTRSNTTALMASSNYTARTSVKCWAAGAARSVTIVRLDTGQVLMNFRGTAADGPTSLLSSNTMIAPFTAPMTGTPMPYPAQTGQVADRVYIGDADGALWRIDLSNPDPTKWSANLAWDAYSASGDGPQLAEPMQTSTVISTNPVGDTVLLFSTGDQQLLSANTSMTTRVWSLVEKRNSSLGKPQLTENWVKTFVGGERVTGPMALFDSVAYFSTFAPATTGASCSYGSSNLWALDYQTGASRFPNVSSPGTFKDYETAPNTIIFGVAVSQTPSCSDTVSTTDAYFGSHTGASNLTGGTYQVVWQKGPGNGVVSNTSIKTDSYSGLQSMDLQTPRLSTKIDSWASIVE